MVANSLKALIALLVLWPALVWAQCSGGTCYVTTGGSDSNNCSNNTTQACATIQRAHDLAVCGNTIEVGSGTFTQTTVLSKACTGANPLSVHGMGQGNTIIDGDIDVSGGWTLETGAPYTGSNVYGKNIGLGRLSHMRNATTGETFRLISDACMDGTRTDCWSGTNKDGDWLLTQSSTDQFTERINNINAWSASRIRYGTKSSNRTYFREKDGINPNTLNLRASPSSGNAANVFTISGNSINLERMTIIGGRRTAYITGQDIVLEDITATNNLQGIMTFGAVNVTIRRPMLDITFPWTTYSGRPPVCGWSNEVVGSDERSACALHRREGKATTGLTTIKEAAVWIENSDGVVVEDGELANRGAIVFMSNSDNVTIRRNYLHNCSSGCISFSSGNWTNLQIYDNDFHDFPNAIQTADVMQVSDVWDAYIYNNRLNTLSPYGGLMELRGPQPPAPTPNSRLFFYHNSGSGNKNGIAWGGSVDGMPTSIMVNNLLDHDYQHGQNINSTFRNDPDGMACSDYNWSRGGGIPNAFSPVPNNYDSAGAKAWDDSTVGLYPPAKWQAIPATATGTGLSSVTSGTFTCKGAQHAALPWNSAAPAPGVNPNMGAIPWSTPPPAMGGMAIRGGRLRSGRK